MIIRPASQSTVRFTASPEGTYTWDVEPKNENGVTATIVNGELKLSGVPTETGTYKYKVTATATESGATATAEVSFEVMQSDEKKEPAVSYTPLEKPEPELTEKVNKKLSELIDGLPEGAKILDNDNIIPQTGDLNAFIESINEKEKEEEGEKAATREITAVLTPVAVREAGVYFMKVIASDDQKEAMKGGYDLQYHVAPYSPDVEADVKAAILADAEASDGSRGTLVDANGEKLDSGAYDGEKQLYVLAFFAQADTPYAQYLTMEAEKPFTGPTSDKDGGGCDSGLGLAGLLALVGLVAARRGKSERSRS